VPYLTWGTSSLLAPAGVTKESTTQGKVSHCGLEKAVSPGRGSVRVTTEKRFIIEQGKREAGGCVATGGLREHCCLKKREGKFAICYPFIGGGGKKTVGDEKPFEVGH